MIGRIAGIAFALVLTSCATERPAGPIQAPVTIPFERGVQGHVIIPVTVQGVDGYAMLDNGAEVSVVVRDFAAGHSLVQGGLGQALSKALTSGFEFGAPAVISVGGIEERVKPLLLDADLLNKAAGKPILGVVGEEFFERQVVEVNFEARTVTLYDRRAFTPPADATLIPLKSATSAKVLVPGSLEGSSNIKITFDIGSSNIAMIDNGPVTERWDAEGRPWTPDGSGVVQHGEFKKSENRLMTAKTISFAGFTLNDVPTTTMPKDFVSPADISLGVNALDRFDVIFDVGGKRLWVRPRAEFGRPFRHRLVGLGWKTPAEAEGLEVTDVARNSPAEAAGLKKGDVIVSFNGQPATQDSFARLKPGDVVELKLRDGSLRTLAAARYY
jgi:hypothetical protein